MKPVADNTSLPNPALPEQAQRLAQLATRMETPCGDGSIVWHVWGQPGAEPIVLLHGGSGSWLHWIRTIEPLVAAGRRVYVPDLPGFGDSTNPPGGGDGDAMVEPLSKGMLQLLGGAPVDLVGFSFGGMVGGFIAAAKPGRVRRLVIVGAPALGIGNGKRLPLRAWRHLPTQAERDAVHHSNLATLMLLHPESIDPLAVAIQAANVVRDRMTTRRLAMTDALIRALEQVSCPVWAIYGEEDAIYRPWKQQLREVLATVPTLQSLQMVADAGHWVQYERPAAFDAALENCLGA